jgi:putative NADH-flavin reductase
MAGTKCIAVFGGSGKTGQELISAALKKGFDVRGLFRPGSEPQGMLSGLEVIIGQVTESADIRRTLEGTSGAIVVFGPRLGRRNHPQAFCAEATAKIVTEMKALGIHRLIVQTGAMAGGDTPNWSRGVRMLVHSYRRRYPEIDADRDAQEVITKKSGLDWTLAKPFRISGARGKNKEKVRVAQDLHIGAFTSIRRADLVEFLVDEFVPGVFHKQAVYVVN